MNIRYLCRTQERKDDDPKIWKMTQPKKSWEIFVKAVGIDSGCLILSTLPPFSLRVKIITTLISFFLLTLLDYLGDANLKHLVYIFTGFPCQMAKCITGVGEFPTNIPAAP